MLSYFGAKSVSATQNTTAWGSGMNSGSSCANFPSAFAGNSGQFDAYWQGKFDATTAGVYNFGTDSDDGSGIYVDGTLVVDNFYSQGSTFRSGSISLTAGYHDITIAYIQTGGGLAFDAKYEAPGASSYSIISNSVLATLLPGGGSNLLPATTALSISANSTLDLNGDSQQVASLKAPARSPIAIRARPLPSR